MEMLGLPSDFADFPDLSFFFLVYRVGLSIFSSLVSIDFWRGSAIGLGLGVSTFFY